MPLLFPDSSQNPQAVLAQASNASREQPHFLVFFASVDPQTGKPWCPGQSQRASEGISERTRRLTIDAAPPPAAQTAPRSSPKSTASSRRRAAPSSLSATATSALLRFLRLRLLVLRVLMRNARRIIPCRNRWKKPENAFRQRPFNISKIPTIIRIQGSADNVAAEASPLPGNPVAEILTSCATGTSSTRRRVWSNPSCATSPSLSSSSSREPQSRVSSVQRSPFFVSIHPMR